MMQSRAFRIGVRVIFVLSLLLNAVALGLLLRAGGLRDRLNGGSDGLAGLPDDMRAEVRAELRAGKGDIGPALDRLGAARAAMFAAAKARPYDPAALEAAMAEVRVATEEVQATVQKHFAAAVAKAAAGE